MIFKQYHWNSLEARRLPPGPPKIPVIGHLHHIVGALPYHYPLRHLADVYGPLMYLKFGEIPTIIISSPDAARKALKAHDGLACAGRPINMAIRIITYNCTNIVFSPYLARTAPKVSDHSSRFAGTRPQICSNVFGTLVGRRPLI